MAKMEEVRDAVVRLLLIGAIVNLVLAGHSAAWTSHPQPFPSGEATVVRAYHCWAHQYCDYTTRAEWEAEIQDAVQTWNEAGSNFRFQERAGHAGDEPCRNTSGHIFIILSDLYPEHVCPQDEPLRGSQFAVFRYGSGWGRLYVKYHRLNLLHVASAPPAPRTRACPRLRPSQ